MRRPSRTTSLFAAPPVALVLLAIALAERGGAEVAAFYLFLLGIPVSAVAGLAALGRLVDSANGGPRRPLARLDAVLAGTLVAVFVVGAAARSPAALELEAPGLANTAVALGFSVVVVQALAALAPVRR